VLTPSSIVIQFEDFKNPFPALEKYAPKYPCFNDDIQGTGAVILAGIINALKQTKIPVAEQRAVFMGAGSAGVGVAKQIVEYFMKEGLSEEEARRCFWFVDTKVRSLLCHILMQSGLQRLELMYIPGSHYRQQRRRSRTT
jgi:malic enzyme